MKRIEKNAIYFDVDVNGRPFEVMIETGGKFEGMVHIFDKSKKKSRNQDVVVSGAVFTSGQLIALEEDIFEPIDGLLEAAEQGISRLTLN